MKKLTILFILLSAVSMGQSVKIRELKRDSTKWYIGTNEPAVAFPVITAHAKDISMKINSQLIAAFADTENWNNSFDAAIDSAAATNLYSLGYEVTFNQNNVLSITLSIITCGAYCTGWSAYFNFNITTGEQITMDDILISAKKKAFEDMVKEEKTDALLDYKKEIKDELAKNTMDTSTYQFALEIVDSECINSISLKQFSLSDARLEIHDECDFPHVIQGMGPDYKLEYQYADISKFLSPDWKKILIK
jgi:hypothetical protein